MHAAVVRALKQSSDSCVWRVVVFFCCLYDGEQVEEGIRTLV